MPTPRYYQVTAGNLDKRITIQAKTIARDSFSGETITYYDLDTVWANIRVLSGREFFLAKQVNSEVDYEITIRYRADVNTTRRIKYSDSTVRYFDIKAVLDKEMNRKWLTLMCSEVT